MPTVVIKHGLFKKAAAVLMAGVMLFTSNSVQLLSFAQTDLSGVGIFNHVMTSQEAVETKYTLRFYTNYGNDEVIFENEMEYPAPDI